ncbi:MAG: methylated-DNA--[protein]-cysteine S-methyltransferase [Betaproteobacteria bacterium]|nr:methylated-DNA--[protein]-cysteine S-methyltransferase [Betaproteobacteria bacterium]
MTTLTLRMNHASTPIGDILILSDPEGLVRAIEFKDRAHRMHRLLRAQYGANAVTVEDSRGPVDCVRKVRAYFQGDLAALDQIGIATCGTPFQRSVWTALRLVGAGQTISYGGLAARVGRPAAARAVGLANATNPIPLIVPCHRVIGADGSLTGYGGGLDRKRWLLDHERTPH